MKNLILFITLFFAANAQADSCWEEFKEHTEFLMTSRDVQYRFLDLKFEGIPEKAQSYAQAGQKNELVMLMHGYLGNPYELKTVADMMNKAGYYVYSGLIPGYGATAKIANKYSKDKWLRWSVREIKRAEKCFSKIHLIGFSTGGSIFHDYVTTYPEDKNIASVTFISAFFDYRPEFEPAMMAAKVSGVREMDLKWIFDKIPVSDARVIIDNPDMYLQRAPVKSMFEVIKLGHENKKRKLDFPSLVPALGVISGEDWVSDPRVQEEVLKRNFFDLELRTFYRPGHVPHQIMISSVSQASDQVHEAILDFIKRH